MLKPSERSIQALLEWETGGRAYYEARLAKPSWPGGSSGVTIGVGYDLGYVAPAVILEDWAAHPERHALAMVAGVTGLRAARAAKEVAHVRVPWEQALAVFRDVTLPRCAAITERVLPGVEALPPDAQGALLSLVYNRGSAMVGDKRREMRAVRAAVARGDLPEIARQIRAMKRLWIGKGLGGLVKRREAEAALVEGAMISTQRLPQRR